MEYSQKTLQISVKNDLTAFKERNSSAGYEVKFDIPSRIKAPIAVGDVIGKAYLVKDGVVVKEEDVVSLEDVKSKSLFDAIHDIASDWGTRAINK